MKILSKASGHWTDEQLIASLYDVGPEDDHFRECASCQERLSILQTNRTTLERAANETDDVNFAFLAAQRRRIHAGLSGPVDRWTSIPARRWASAVGTLLVLGGGFVMFEQYQHNLTENKISDVQLAQEMSRISQDLEAQPVAPLQGMFE